MVLISLERYLDIEAAFSIGVGGKGYFEDNQHAGVRGERGQTSSGRVNLRCVLDAKSPRRHELRRDNLSHFAWHHGLRRWHIVRLGGAIWLSHSLQESTPN